MKLKDFPLTMRAFKEIALDSGGSQADMPRGETEIPDYWLIPFQSAEEVFSTCGDKTVDYVPALSGKEEYTIDTTLWQIICLGADEDDMIVMRHLVIHPAVAWNTVHLLYQYFDGELVDTFTSRVTPFLRKT